MGLNPHRFKSVTDFQKKMFIKDFVLILIQDKSRRNIEVDEFQLKSNIFFIHPDYNTTYGANNFDICLLKTPPNEFGVHEDLTTKFDFIPCLPDKEIELEKVRSFLPL